MRWTFTVSGITGTCCSGFNRDWDVPFNIGFIDGCRYQVSHSIASCFLSDTGFTATNVVATVFYRTSSQPAQLNFSYLGSPGGVNNGAQYVHDFSSFSFCLPNVMSLRVPQLPFSHCSGWPATITIYPN